MTKLSCGGQGPCCHVAYHHRHCEHCDVVIDLRQRYELPPRQTFPWFQPNPLNPYVINGASAPTPPLPKVYALTGGNGYTSEVTA